MMATPTPSRPSLAQERGAQRLIVAGRRPSGPDTITRMSIKEGAAEKRLDEQLRRRGIALSADEFKQVIVDALEDLSDPGSGSSAPPHR